MTTALVPNTTLPPNVAVHARGLGVRYSLRFTRKTTMRDSFSKLLNRKRGDREFWALREVDLRLVHGESLGVIGPNGAGKSTLLQALAGIITPSEGTIDVRGQISSLLQLGAGFDQELTGRDNILLAGAFMGVETATMRDRLEDIIAFTDIGEFIDAPFRTYSTGMKARLGFSIATSVEPDVLLLDEVLGTGDQSFRDKSRDRVLQLVKAAKAIVLVTHDMTWVEEFCNRAMLLEHGRIMAEGDPAEVVRMHRERSAEASAKRAEEMRAAGFR